MKMKISMVFKAVLMLGLATPLLGVDTVPKPQKSRGKKEGRSRHVDPQLKPSRCSRERTSKLWIKVDPALLNSSSSPLTSPRLSLSPWTYDRPSCDENRIPSCISEAKCEMMGCLTKEGQVDMGLESKPIFYQILVLRRVKIKKKKQHALQLEKRTVSVGCTCSKPHIVPQI
ncbi:interleukin 17a/f3 [Brachyhypopomus gauderio]|uniref:interleukin 17a/f3 n=1 Tax=Brachyhypopomus gauderio TaxID=698409 RepID=UPI004041541F